MPGDCYLCELGYNTIPGSSASNALGTCGFCSILACGQHAQREPNAPRWVCVLCDASLLMASGIAAVGGSALGSTLGMLVSSALLREGQRYPTLEQFLEARQGFGWIRDEVQETLFEAPRRFTTNLTEPFWFQLSPDGQALIAAALLLVERFELREEDLVEALRLLVSQWRQSRP